MPRICLILLFSIVFVSCKTGGSPDQRDILSVSILPQKYFVERIAGNNFRINVMVPPGASPATWEPTPGQLRDLGRSVAYYRIGHIGFERAWMQKLRSVNPAMAVADLSSGTGLIGSESHSHGDNHGHGGIDPHIWLSPVEAKVMIENLTAALSFTDPVNEGLYSRNASRFIQEIDSLTRVISHKLEPYRGRSFVIFHPALTYFARDFGLVQVPIEMEGKEPSPAYLKELVDLGKSQNIKAVLVQQEFDMDNARAVARELGGRVIRINPLAEKWMESLEAITDSLITAFEITQ